MFFGRSLSAYRSTLHFQTSWKLRPVELWLGYGANRHQAWAATSLRWPHRQPQEHSGVAAVLGDPQVSPNELAAHGDQAQILP